MKRLYALLFNITLISTCSIAKPEKADTQVEVENSAKVKSSKLVDYTVKKGDTLYSIAKKHHTTVRKVMLINGIKGGDHLSLGEVLKVPTETVVYAKAEKNVNTPAVSVKPKAEKASKKTVAVSKSKKTEKVAAAKKAPKRKKLIHTVKKGDTLSKIAKNNNVSMSALRKANKLKSSDTILLGQKLIIPQAKKTKTKTAKPKTKANHTKLETDVVPEQKLAESAIKSHEVKKGDSLYKIARSNHTTVDALKKVNKIKSEKGLRLGQILTIPAEKESVAVAAADSKTEETKTVSVAKKSKGKIHTIVKGDSLYKIAKNNKTTVEALKKANRIKSDKSLKLGQKLSIPARQEELVVAAANTRPKAKELPAAKKSKDKTHTIVKGDSLYKIAKNNKTTVKALKKANKIKSDKSLKLGQVLVIPGSAESTMIASAGSDKKKKESVKIASIQKNSKKETATYTVKKGDTLYKIAKRNNTTIGELKKANKIKSEKSLRLGQVLKMPGGADNVDKKIKLASAEPEKKAAEVSKNKDAAKESKTKLAKGKTKTEKTKVAKAETHKKKKTKVASSKKSSPKKLAQKPKQSKKSFLATLSLTSKSPLKLSAAKKQLGKRYVWGAEGPYSFDCSGFTSYVCKKSGIHLPRRSIEQSKVGKRVSRRDLKPGDLVFFDTSRRRRGYVNHVGIYLGNNKFIHASSAKKRVVIASLEKPFYKSRFKWGRRIKS